LIVQSVVGLKRHAEIGRVCIVDLPIRAAVVTVLVERSRDHRSRLGADRGGQRQFLKGRRVFLQAGALTQSFIREEAKKFVFLKRPANASTELLAGVRRISGSSVSQLLICVERLIAE